MDKINSYQQRREKSCFYLRTGLILLSVLLACSYGEKSYQSTCETIPSEIHITKGKQNILQISKLCEVRSTYAQNV